MQYTDGVIEVIAERLGASVGLRERFQKPVAIATGTTIEEEQGETTDQQRVRSEVGPARIRFEGGPVNQELRQIIAPL